MKLFYRTTCELVSTPPAKHTLTGKVPSTIYYVYLVSNFQQYSRRGKCSLRLPYFTVPPAFLMSSRADFETAQCSMVSFFSSLPVPKIFTIGGLPFTDGTRPMATKDAGEITSPSLACCWRTPTFTMRTVSSISCRRYPLSFG